MRVSKRLVLLGLWIAVLAVLFCSGPRYPELNAKVFIGGETLLEDPLSFEVVAEIQVGDPL